MGAELFPRHPRELKTASEILGYDLVPLCGGGGDHLLDQTQYAQPAIFVVNALAFTEHVLRSGNPRFAAGHSLGEYNALLAAGVFDFETGLGIVKKRGELMQRAAGGAMAAVIGLPTERIQSLLREHDLEALDVANINSPDQTVISGPRPLVETARSVFEGRGGRYVVLKVSGAFHSRYMRIITEEFRAFLGEVALKEPEIPVIANVTGRPYGADEVRSGLVDQLVSPVRWVDTIAWLAGQGDYDFLELGTGTVLTRLTEQILPATGRREDGG
jgi:trans-AT polyketide synthase/acyltransferase/oxidoreductase domain-containing protein